MDIPEIRPVERENEMETREILRHELPRAIAADGHAMALCGGNGPGVRRIADMPIACARRIHTDRQPIILRNLAKRAFGQR